MGKAIKSTTADDAASVLSAVGGMGVLRAVRLEGEEDDNDEGPLLEPEESVRWRQIRFFRKFIRLARTYGWKRVILVAHSKYCASLFGRVAGEKKDDVGRVVKKIRAFEATLQDVSPL